jgi:hypothetical protein
MLPLLPVAELPLESKTEPEAPLEESPENIFTPPADDDKEASTTPLTDTEDPEIKAEPPMEESTDEPADTATSPPPKPPSPASSQARCLAASDLRTTMLSEPAPTARSLLCVVILQKQSYAQPDSSI